MNTLRLTLGALALGTILGLAMLSGCERAGGAPRVHTFVGYVENSDAFVALVRADDSVVAYVCDGRKTATWLRGEADGRTFDVTAGEARLRAVFERGAITGTFTSAQGGAYPFVARPAAAGGGFYRATATLAGLGYVGGWIVLSDGQQRGAVKRDGVILRDAGALDPRRPTVTLPDGGTMRAEPAARMLAATPS